MKSSARQAFAAPFPFLRATLRYMQNRYGSYRAMEVIYRELFVRELLRLGIEDRFFPVGAAANHGLLYLVLRCYVELPLRRVLDVGAGQTACCCCSMRSIANSARPRSSRWNMTRPGPDTSADR